ncbi:unnamed protein product, partial [Allacma fusca]
MEISEHILWKPKRALMGPEPKVKSYFKFLRMLSLSGQVRCYKGQEKFNMFPIYWNFQAPIRSSLIRALHAFMESGIFDLLHKLWLKESENLYDERLTFDYGKGLDAKPRE